MMPTAEGMTHMIPNHVLRVGQTIHLNPGDTQETLSRHPSFTEPTRYHGDPDLDVSLDNLNRLILELDPTFEPIQADQSPSCISPNTGSVSTQLNLLFNRSVLFTTRLTKCNIKQRFDTNHNKTTLIILKQIHSLGLWKSTLFEIYWI